VLALDRPVERLRSDEIRGGAIVHGLPSKSV
jgi:hypothetical protein